MKIEDDGSPAGSKPPPNLLLILTDQQRQPRHWPEEKAWLDELTPADAELARTGLSFTEACAATCMCSPSRASILTGRWPAEHGVNLTLTRGGVRPNPKNIPTTIRSAIKAVRVKEISAAEALKTVVRGATRKADGGLDESELNPETPNLATILERAGYRTVLKGKWHLSQPAGDDWADQDSIDIADNYGIEGWQPPDAGENIDPSNFGGGRGAGVSKEGHDEDFARQAVKFLNDPPAEPWALIVSLVNPHDVLAFPSSFEEGGYDRREWGDIEGIELPDSVDENLAGKPSAQAYMKLGQASFIGGLSRDEQLEYCRFYAHLHRLADSKVGRLLDVLGDPEDPDSLRSKTIIVKTSDHGELGMAHGGMRQKMFNAYDETINVPLIVSNPVLFPESARSAAPVSLCDLLPTFATLAGVDASGDGIRGHDLSPVIAHAARPDRERLGSSKVDFHPVVAHDAPVESVQDEILFTFDDDQAGTAYRDVTPPPNRIRAVRSAGSMYGVYFDPKHRAAPQYELYDMVRDPGQVRNLVDRDTGLVLDPRDQALLVKMQTALAESCRRAGADLPG